MKFEKQDIVWAKRITLVLAVGAIIYFLGNFFLERHHVKNWCKRACGTFGSRIIDNKCYCSTSAGWTRHKKAKRVQKKMERR